MLWEWCTAVVHASKCPNLRLVDEPKVFQNSYRAALSVECVHVQAWGAGVQDPLAHASAQIYPEVFDCLIVILDGL